MQQFECGHCGYDMTGIERFSKTVNVMPYTELAGIAPMAMSGFYNSTASQTITCPNCGKSGYWIKH